MKKMFLLLVIIVPISLFSTVMSFGMGFGAVQYNGNWGIGNNDFQLADMGYRGNVALRLTMPIIPLDFDMFANYDWISEIKAQGVPWDEYKSYSLGINSRYRFHIPPWVNVYTGIGVMQQTYWYKITILNSIVESDKETAFGGSGYMGVEFFIPATQMSFEVEGGFKSLFRQDMPYELFIKTNIWFGII